MFSILIVDDHKHLVESLATTTPWEQYEVTRIYKAYSGTDALKLVEEHEIDIVLTDIRMPGMSGLELIEQAKARQRDIECILITGYADFEYAKRAIELQAVDYLMKPVRDEALSVSMNRIVQRRRKQLEKKKELEQSDEALRTMLEQLQTDLMVEKAFAESSMLEERSRIAADIHDLVGHTLTTTLVQIEAAKRLLVRNEQEGLKRLEFSQDLVRKSLNDIREAVWKMQSAKTETATDLEPALLHLIRVTEKAADISITCRIEALPPTDPLRSKAICHALQEGLTNGIRHGNATRFEFELLPDAEGGLHFALWNDGAPYSADGPGFGMKAMEERVRKLDGSVQIASTDTPRGTRLTIWLPSGKRKEEVPS
ncbi:response regulator [Paenibacillus allorhizosphaerae]|uniref:histidine kinase n=1 Tax=Paenibacillus allorhizosphaerae TaxID=2849866 RepID=A0ABN7TVK2_9BACL|nr:response regulator [Paenibacillus allorhizosphaerae]CAG7653832.1 Regulator of RpoS [Paenibacillus allorhizosphaerae]